MAKLYQILHFENSKKNYRMNYLIRHIYLSYRNQRIDIRFMSFSQTLNAYRNRTKYRILLKQSELDSVKNTLSISV